MQIKAKVAEILTDYRVALNAGKSKGVQRGAMATVYRVVAVKDPETGEPLGTVTVPKVRLRVVHVQDLLSVAEVADRAGGDDDPYERLSISSQWKPLKTIATSKAFEDSNSVYIAVGDDVTLQTDDGEKKSS